MRFDSSLSRMKSVQKLRILLLRDRQVLILFSIWNLRFELRLRIYISRPRTVTLFRIWLQFTTRGRTESNNRIRLKQFFAKRLLVSIRGNYSSKNSSDNRFAYIFFSISLLSFFPSPLFFQNREQSFKQKKRITVPATVHFSASNNIRYIRAVYIDDSDVGGGVKKLQWRERE